MTSREEAKQPMTTREELVGNLPLQYFDGPDYCTVKDATGGNFALTVQPGLMKLMEDALASRQEVSVEELARVIDPIAFGIKPSMYGLRSQQELERHVFVSGVRGVARDKARALLAEYSITKRKG